jgi:hypothetical protein
MSDETAALNLQLNHELLGRLCEGYSIESEVLERYINAHPQFKTRLKQTFDRMYKFKTRQRGRLALSIMPLIRDAAMQQSKDYALTGRIDRLYPDAVCHQTALRFVDRFLDDEAAGQ